MTSVPPDAQAPQEWRDGQGRLHREDGPAWVSSSGAEEWRRHGELHRVGGPAMVKEHALIWAVDGRRHRLDGPAVVYRDGTVEWWVDGARIHGQDADLLAEVHDAGEAELLVAVLEGWKPGVDVRALVGEKRRELGLS